MKTFVKVVIAILVVVLLALGIYMVLPETTQMFIKGNIQYRTNDEAKEHIDKIMDSKIPGSDTRFKKGLEKTCKSTAWYYEGKNEDNWTVTFYGSKASFSFADDMLPSGTTLKEIYTSKPLKIVFRVRDAKNVDIEIYIAGERVDDNSVPFVYNKIANK